MQFEPPAPDSVSVTDPALHTAHATVDALLYCPAAHAVHAVAPLPVNVSVVDPAPHTVQPVVPLPLYCPAPHTTHAVDALLS
jgi:hypothetical protein